MLEQRVRTTLEEDLSTTKSDLTAAQQRIHELGMCVFLLLRNRTDL